MAGSNAHISVSLLNRPGYDYTIVNTGTGIVQVETYIVGYKNKAAVCACWLNVAGSVLASNTCLQVKGACLPSR